MPPEPRPRMCFRRSSQRRGKGPALRSQGAGRDLTFCAVTQLCENLSMFLKSFTFLRGGGIVFELLSPRHDIPAGGPLKAHTVVGTRACTEALCVFQSPLRIHPNGKDALRFVRWERFECPQ